MATVTATQLLGQGLNIRGGALRNTALQFGAGTSDPVVSLGNDNYFLRTVYPSTSHATEINYHHTAASTTYQIQKIVYLTATDAVMLTWATLGFDFSSSLVPPVGTDLFAKNDQVTGNGFADYIDLSAGNDAAYGGIGADSLIGGIGRDSLYGGDGNDHLWGTTITSTTAIGASDLLNGGTGTDTAHFLGTNPTVPLTIDLRITIAQDTGQGLDTLIAIENITSTGSAARLVGNSGANVLSAGAANDTLYGAQGNDTLIGGAGNDVLNGGIGNDNLDGGDGIDTAHFYGLFATRVDLRQVNLQDTGHGIDILSGFENVTTGDGNDTVTGSDSDNLLITGQGNDIIYGGYGLDSLSGRGGDDRLYGSFASDRLYGGTGNDTLIGGDASDSLIGGEGQDTFKFISRIDSIQGLFTRDVIHDFTTLQDHIDLSVIDANAGRIAGNGTFAYSGSTPRAFSVWVVDLGTSLEVRADVTGNTLADIYIKLAETDTIARQDFIL